MASRYISHADRFRREFEARLRKRVAAASIFLASQVRADVSQPGTLRYTPYSQRKSRKWVKQKTIYDFTHSRPGNPPYKQKGDLRKSLAWEMQGLVGRVGSNIRRPKYPLYLELGTRKMAARPYLRAGLTKYRDALARLLSAGPQGPLPAVVSNPYRPGHFGRGARRAGWD